MATRGPRDVLRAAVTEYVDSSQLSPDTARKVADVNERAWENAVSVRRVIHRCMTAPDAVYGPGTQFDQWLSTALGANLEATKLRVGGLFDMTFAKPLAEILDAGAAPSSALAVAAGTLQRMDRPYCSRGD
jgi:hypothetical protein